MVCESSHIILVRFDMEYKSHKNSQPRVETIKIEIKHFESAIGIDISVFCWVFVDVVSLYFSKTIWDMCCHSLARPHTDNHYNVAQNVRRT